MDSGAQKPKTPFYPFRRAVVRGLGMVLPPLLTIVIFVWVGNTVAIYLLEPLEAAARRGLLLRRADIRENLPLTDRGAGIAVYEGREYRQTTDEKFIPLAVYREVQHNLGDDPMPVTATGIYRRYIDQIYLRRHYVVPLFLCLFILSLYLLGKFLAAGVGKFFWTQFEHLIRRLPLVRNVYSSVKQVTDFLFTEREVEYTRIVAIEYPRKGCWALGMVTGEGFLDISSAANEPVVSLLIPTSPMPLTGFTAIVKKSETLDLNITVDQALQFLVSCGVVVPPHQLAGMVASPPQGAEGGRVLPGSTDLAPEKSA